MKTYPQFPEDWDDANQTLYHKFVFRSTPDIECLIRLVREGIPDRGNDGVLRARLLGILNSMFSDANARFWLRHYHPKTWRLRMFIRNVRHWYHRKFRTRQFRNQVELCNIARNVTKRMSKEL